MAMSLAAARVNANLSRKQVCEKLDLHPNTLANYESYITSPDMKLASKFCELYGCEFKDIKWHNE